MIKEEDIKPGLLFCLNDEDVAFGGLRKDKNGEPIVYTVDRIVEKDGDKQVIGKYIEIENGIQFVREYVLSVNTFTDSSFNWSNCGLLAKIVKRENASTVYDPSKDVRMDRKEQVSHPSHYAWLKGLCGVEPLDICRHLDFNVGNALKYLLRKDKADGDKTKTEKRIEDLKKAVFYIEDEIRMLKEKKKG